MTDKKMAAHNMTDPRPGVAAAGDLVIEVYHGPPPTPFDGAVLYGLGGSRLGLVLRFLGWVDPTVEEWTSGRWLAPGRAWLTLIGWAIGSAAVSMTWLKDVLRQLDADPDKRAALEATNTLGGRPAVLVFLSALAPGGPEYPTLNPSP